MGKKHDLEGDTASGKPQQDGLSKKDFIVQFQEPVWTEVHLELNKKGVTKQLLGGIHPAVSESLLQLLAVLRSLCRMAKKQKRSMRQTHRAGEKLFIAYAGPTVPVVCEATGNMRTAQIFVAVLGASNYTFAEATWSQILPDWLAHI